MRGPAIVNPTAGAWKTRILDQAFRCGWRLCSVPIESWAAGGPVKGAALGASPVWLVCVGCWGALEVIACLQRKEVQASST